MDLSDSDEEAPEDVAVLDDLEKDLEPDVDSSDEEPVHTAPAAPKRAALWKTTDSSPQAWLPDFNVTSDSGEVRALWRPFEYFQEYISDEMWETMSTAMNTAHVVETGKSLCTTPEELKVFFALSITMSCLGYPQIRMYWAKRTKVPLVANHMTRERFFTLRSRLKVVNALDVDDATKAQDRLWRIRPLVVEVQNGCLRLPREELLSIDEQMIPFTGRTHLKQFVPRKPNPEGLKNFVLASPSGFILDFEIYQGKKSLLHPGSSGIGESAVLRLTQSLTKGTKLFFDRYFTSSGLLDKLAEKEIAATGTVMNNRVPKTVKLSSESQLKQRGRGASEMWVRNDDKQVVVRWYDNKPVTLMSSLHGKEPQDTCRRWCAKEKRHIDVPRPHIVQAYNANMGGVDMADRMLSFYRMKARVKKWTIRCIFHLFDIALCNAWILYMQDMSSLRKQKKDILKFLDFRMSVADVLVAQMSQLSSDDDDALWSPPEKRAPLPPSEVRTKTVGHMPRLADIPNAARCRWEGCSMKTKFFCTKCKLFFASQKKGTALRKHTRNDVGIV